MTEKRIEIKLKEKDVVVNHLKRKRKTNYNYSNKVQVEEHNLVSSDEIKPKYLVYLSDFKEDGVIMKKRVRDEDGQESFPVEKKVSYGSVVVDYPVYSVDESREQLRGMSLFFSEYSLRPDLFVGNPWDDNEEMHLRILLSIIKSPNLIFDDLVLFRDIGNTHPGVVTRPKYLTDKISSIDDVFPGAKYAMDNSFLSGTGLVGVYRAFRKFAQDHIHVAVDVSEFSVAYMRFHVLLNMPTIYLPDVTQSDLMGYIDLPNTSKDGYNHGSNYYIKTVEKSIAGKFLSSESTTHFTKSSCQRSDSKYVAVESIIRMKRQFDAGNRSMDVFGVPVHIVAQKIDAKEPGEDRDKTRNFGFASNPKMPIDFVLAKQFHSELNRRASISIGFKWINNGASHMGKKYEVFIKNKWFYSVFDMSGLDYTLKEGMISLLANEPSYYFSHDKNYDFYCWLSSISSTYTSTKHMAWYGRTFKKKASDYIASKHICRLTRGCLCSGEYQTSSIDSRYVAIVLMCFDEWISKMLEKGDDYSYVYNGQSYVADFSNFSVSLWIQQFISTLFGIGKERDFIPRDVYGDDGLLAYYEVFFDLLCKKVDGRFMPLLLMHYIETRFFMVPKVSEVSVYSWRYQPYPFLSSVSKDLLLYSGV